MTKGFSLIESIIYIFCLSLFFALFTIFAVSFFKNSNTNISRLHKYIELLVCQDYFLDDINLANHISFTTDNLTLRTLDSKEYKWLIKDDRLLRHFYYYDKLKNKFILKSSNLAFIGLKNFKTQPIYFNRNLVAIKYVLEANKFNHVINSFKALRIGMEL